MKPVLMIHEVRESIFDLPLADYVLTFDDGLYSQYCYFKEFRKIDTPKLFFISSGIVCEDGKQSTDFPTCDEAHMKAFTGNKEDYMTVAQIKELMLDPQVTIGGHSHSHVDLKTLQGLSARMAHIMKDTTEMLVWFDSNLNLRPTSFCFPYNNSIDQLYSAALKNFGFKHFYGHERIPA